MKYKFDGKRFKKNFKRDWQLHLMVILPVIYIIIFDFIPIYGQQIAFRDFRPRTGLTGSEWVGLKWFEKFLSNPEFWKLMKNTVAISLYALATFPVPVIFALILNAMTGEKYKKVVTTIANFPHFISTVILVGIMNMLLSPTSGMYANLYHLFGGEGFPTDIRYISSTFRHLYVWSTIWQNLGWSAIIYTAALSSVSPELHEAAQMDGASRWKRIWCIDLPTIMPTVAINFILRCTGLIGVGFEKAYMMQKATNLEVSEVLSTYVFKEGLSSFRKYSYGTAISMFNTVVNLVLLITINALVKKATDDEVTLY
jgi:putative aldouronate transport system permease protein